MASIKQQKPATETCPQEQHRFWGSKVFGGHKPNTDQQVAKEPQPPQHQQNNGWWFGGHKQATATATATATAQTQHCNTCQCSTPDKSLKPTCGGANKKEHTIGVTITEGHITASKHGKGTPPKLGAKTEMKMEEQISGKKVEMKEQHAGNLAHVKNNMCTDAKSQGKKEEATGVHNKATVSGAPVKKKEQRENHCFRSMAGHVKQRIAMMRNSHDDKSSDSSSSDSEDEKTDKKKEKGHSQGTKATAK